MANIISYTLFPRYQWQGRHMIPVVAEAVRRVLYDDGSITHDLLSAAEYHAAISTHAPAMRETRREGATA